MDNRSYESKKIICVLVTLNEVLKDAQQKKYAVGLFNTVNLEMAKGVLMAAEEMRSPVIIGTAEILLPYASLEELSYFLVPMAKKSKVPVVLHFEHGLTLKRILEAVKLGFSSVMYDCSTASYSENIANVRELIKYIHTMGVSVEAELGHVGANEAGAAEGMSEQDQNIYTQPEQAEEFVASTQVDALAVAFGTAHGAYKSRPKLNFDILEDISHKVPTPLVLHGGSGLSDDDFRNSIQHGIRKINIFTDINCASARAARDNDREEAGMTDLIPRIVDAVQQETMRKMEVFSCCGRA